MNYWTKAKHKIVFKYLYFEFLFERKFGWFFTNGRKNFNADQKITCLKNKAVRYCQMHSLILALLIVTGFLLGTGNKIMAQNSCNWVEVKKEKIKSIDPFKYYTFKVVNLTQNKNVLIKDFEVPIFANGEYKFVFEPKISSESLKVQIFDISVDRLGTMIPVFESALNNTSTMFNFTNLGNLKRLKIVYTIESDTEQNLHNTNCVLFYSGFIMEEVEEIEKLARLTDLVAY